MQRGRDRSALPHTASKPPSSVVPSPNHVVPTSGGFIIVGYERFLQLPVAVVLAAMWLVGVALLGSCVLTLCALGTLMASVVAG